MGEVLHAQRQAEGGAMTLRGFVWALVSFAGIGLFLTWTIVGSSLIGHDGSLAALGWVMLVMPFFGLFVLAWWAAS